MEGPGFRKNGSVSIGKNGGPRIERTRNGSQAGESEGSGCEGAANSRFSDFRWEVWAFRDFACSSGWEVRQLKLNLYLLLRMLCVLHRYKQFYGVLGNWSAAVTKICKGELQADLTVCRKTYVFAIPRVTSDLPNMGAPAENKRGGAPS